MSSMRATSPSRDLKGLMRGRRVWAATKQKKSVSKTIKPKPATCDCYELDRSFKECAFPSAAEIFRLSEQTDLSPDKIKAEFKRKRQEFRKRNRLAEDSIIYSYTLPRFFMLLNVLCSRLHCTQQTLAQAAVFITSVFSVWLSGCSYTEHYHRVLDLLI